MFQKNRLKLLTTVESSGYREGRLHNLAQPREQMSVRGKQREAEHSRLHRTSADIVCIRSWQNPLTWPGFFSVVTVVHIKFKPWQQQGFPNNERGYARRGRGSELSTVWTLLCPFCWCHSIGSVPPGVTGASLLLTSLSKAGLIPSLVSGLSYFLSSHVLLCTVGNPEQPCSLSRPLSKC